MQAFLQGITGGYTAKGTVPLAQKNTRNDNLFLGTLSRHASPRQSKNLIYSLASKQLTSPNVKPQTYSTLSARYQSIETGAKALHRLPLSRPPVRPAPSTGHCKPIIGLNSDSLNNRASRLFHITTLSVCLSVCHLSTLCVSFPYLEYELDTGRNW